MINEPIPGLSQDEVREIVALIERKRAEPKPGPSVIVPYAAPPATNTCPICLRTAYLKANAAVHSCPYCGAHRTYQPNHSTQTGQ